MFFDGLKDEHFAPTELLQHVWLICSINLSLLCSFFAAPKCFGTQHHQLLFQLDDLFGAQKTIQFFIDVFTTCDAIARKNVRNNYSLCS